MGLSGGAIAGIVIGCVVFVVAKTACKSDAVPQILCPSCRRVPQIQLQGKHGLDFQPWKFALAGMVVFFKWWFKRRQRILASRRGKGDVERGTPLEKLAAVLHLKNKAGSSTGSSSSSGIKAGDLNVGLPVTGRALHVAQAQLLYLVLPMCNAFNKYCVNTIIWNPNYTTTADTALLLACAVQLGVCWAGAHVCKITVSQLAGLVFGYCAEPHSR